jgi:ribosomal protein L16/L10AE
LALILEKSSNSSIIIERTKNNRIRFQTGMGSPEELVERLPLGRAMKQESHDFSRGSMSNRIRKKEKT